MPASVAGEVFGDPRLSPVRLGQAAFKALVQETYDRSDVHTLFDRGYLSVHPEHRTLEVSPRLRSDWGNGDEFYRRQASGESIRVPARKADRPNREFLTWHREAVFMAS